MTKHQKLMLTRYTKMVVRQYEEELAKENKTPAVRKVLEEALAEARETLAAVEKMTTTD